MHLTCAPLFPSQWNRISLSKDVETCKPQYVLMSLASLPTIWTYRITLRALALPSSIIVLINGEPFTICFFSLISQQILPKRSVLSEYFSVSRYTCKCNCIYAQKMNTTFQETGNAQQNHTQAILYRISPISDNTREKFGWKFIDTAKQVWLLQRLSLRNPHSLSTLLSTSVWNFILMGWKM